MKQKLEKIKSFFINNYKWIFLFIFIICLLILIGFVINGDIKALDDKGYYILQKYLISDTITPFVKIFTNFANKYWLVGLSILLIFAINNKNTGIIISINLILSAFTNFIIKQMIQRPRPLDHRIINEKGYSFPSGHSMVSMAFYGFLLYLIYKNMKYKYWKRVLTTILALSILFIGISRVYLGVHYTSDVIGGYLVGISYLIVFIHITHSYNKIENSKDSVKEENNEY